ncbi:tyrosine recombinase XerC [Ralstonia insidiosa]|uniref:Tyrosine recombinase XerC n=1 Tax=Ralstonia insidiosa TaxID=190721 RepID=A0A192A1D5_9RALS|nr:tyrosine recombinase XerC [Ralstonia insidiosa]ANJ74270.1 tyrosine recombinase XerC [Ralstonia insidiosa]KAB0471486.1 tyrosine recombinase XerC [Ralstonia insidiosa]MBY4908980.1 tyrosine recombinase XerC [Ralstonia insidiosa]
MPQSAHHASDDDARDAPAPPHPQIAAYLDALKFERQLSPHTLASYGHELAVLQRLGAQLAAGIDLTQLQTHHIRRMMAQLHGSGLSGRSIARALSAWRGWYKWMALRDAAVTANPVDGVRAPKSPKRLPKALSVEHAVALMEQLPGDDAETIRDRAVNELFYSCGLRLSELVSLDLRHVKAGEYESASWLDLDAREVMVLGKGSKRRTVPVGSKAAEALSAWLAVREQLARPAQLDTAPEDAYALFLSPRGKRLAQRQIQLRMKRNAIEAGVPADVHPHVLRHSFATHMLQSSGDLRAVQELLGHASIASTQVYTSLDFQHLAKIYDQAHPRAKKK